MDSKFTPISGTKYIALSDDIYVTKHCNRTTDLAWDKSILSITEIANVLKPGNTVLDIGAYIGDTTELFIRANCKVYAFEPFEDSFYCLSHNCPTSNNFNVPVGNGEMINFGYTPIPGSMGSRMVFEDTSGIKTIRIDDLNLENCHFIKLDVEGHELYALQGMSETLKKFHPVLHIEINLLCLDKHGVSDNQIYEFLNKHGYNYRVCSFHERAERKAYHEPWDIVAYPN